MSDQSNNSVEFDNEVERHVQFIRNMYFGYDERYNTSLRQKLFIPTFIKKSEKLTELFIDTLIKRTNKIITKIPAGQILITSNDAEICEVKQTYLQRYNYMDNDMLKLLYHQVNYGVEHNMNVYTQKGTFKIPIAERRLTLCRCKHGDEYIMTSIMNWVAENEVRVTSINDMKNITDDIIINFEY
jgi:hypothetical protein